jgi:hypothetical protein
VPSGTGGVRDCLFELDRLVDKYPPSHHYIIAEHGDHVHVSHGASAAGYDGWLQGQFVVVVVVVKIYFQYI